MIHKTDVIIDRSEKERLLSPIQEFKMVPVQNKKPSLTRYPSKRSLFFGFLVIFALVFMACTGTQLRSTGPITYGRTAKINYDRGMAELERKSLERARKYFKKVRREFPYSRFAALSELRLADCDFSEEKYAEAAASYRRFVQLHRTHKNADHASFRRGKSFYEMIPSDWFLVPPSHERDMSATRDALRELRGFLRQYPESGYIEEANDMVTDCYDRLARHEMYVARFYLRRGKHKAAISRTRYVEKRYSKSKLVPEAMFVRGETFIDMEEVDEARLTFSSLIKQHPESSEAEQAREYLKHLGENSGEETAEPDEDQEP